MIEKIINYFSKNKLKLIATGTGRCGTTYIAKLLTALGVNCGHESIFNYETDDVIRKRITNKNCRTLSNISQTEYDHNKRIFIHEKWIDPKTIEADSAYMAAPYLDWPELKKTKIIHVIRNPLHVIKSFVINFNYFNKNIPDKKNIFNELGFEEKIWRFLPELKNIENKFERSCYFYIYWNRIIEEKSKNKEYLRIKIEDENKIKKIANFINKPEINFTENKINDFEKISKNAILNLKKNQKKELFFWENKIKENEKNITLNEIPNGKIKTELLEMMKKYGY